MKVLEKSAPKIKFSGKVDEVDFEMFMVRMEEAMNVEGVTDELRLEHIENWFSGLPLDLVKAYKDNRKEDASIVFQAIKEVLRKQFGSKKCDTEGMLKKMVEGGPIAGDDFEKIQGFVIGLRCKFELAKGKDNAGSFDSSKTYYEILRLKLPHLVDKWSKRFEHGNEEVSFQNFEDFVMERARIQQTSAIIMKSPDDKAKSPLPVKRNEAMGPFASGYPDTSANVGGGRVDRRPRSDEGKPSCCRICSGEHQVAECSKFAGLELDERVYACKSGGMCFKCLDDVPHSFRFCRCGSRCSECGSWGHHTLLHGIRPNHPLPDFKNRVVPTPRSNPL